MLLRDLFWMYFVDCIHINACCFSLFCLCIRRVLMYNEFLPLISDKNDTHHAYFKYRMLLFICLLVHVLFFSYYRYYFVLPPFRIKMVITVCSRYGSLSLWFALITDRSNYGSHSLWLALMARSHDGSLPLWLALIARSHYGSLSLWFTLIIVRSRYGSLLILFVLIMVRSYYCSLSLWFALIMVRSHYGSLL